jgi:hypothetical protein
MAPTVLDALMMSMGLVLAVVAILVDWSERTLSIWKSAIPLPLRVATRRSVTAQLR